MPSAGTYSTGKAKCRLKCCRAHLINRIEGEAPNDLEDILNGPYVLFLQRWSVSKYWFEYWFDPEGRFEKKGKLIKRTGETASISTCCKKETVEERVCFNS